MAIRISETEYMILSKMVNAAQLVNRARRNVTRDSDMVPIALLKPLEQCLNDYAALPNRTISLTPQPNA